MSARRTQVSIQSRPSFGNSAPRQLHYAPSLRPRPAPTAAPSQPGSSGPGSSGAAFATAGPSAAGARTALAEVERVEDGLCTQMRPLDLNSDRASTPPTPPSALQFPSPPSTASAPSQQTAPPSASAPSQQTALPSLPPDLHTAHAAAAPLLPPSPQNRVRGSMEGGTGRGSGGAGGSVDRLELRLRERLGLPFGAPPTPLALRAASAWLADGCGGAPGSPRCVQRAPFVRAAIRKLGLDAEADGAPLGALFDRYDLEASGNIQPEAFLAMLGRREPSLSKGE